MLSRTSILALAFTLPGFANAQSTNSAGAAAVEPEIVVVTGSRIPRPDLTGTSPVAVTTGAQIALDRAVTVEDFSAKLPQLAGGVKSTAVGSDAYGAQTLDLRNFGQNRTLVLINGTRATPFSFRNAVDVNAIPAALLKRVDVLTGGAAAVYGADAVAGVVNFIIDDEFDGLKVSANYEHGKGGGSSYGVNAAYGLDLAGRGNLVVYGEYSEREQLLAGKRSWALRNSTPVASSGGNYTDVASGRTFSFDAAGNFANGFQTTDYTKDYLLVQPMTRTNVSAFGKFDLTEKLELYGRAMFSNVVSTGAPRAGQVPVVISENVTISATNTIIPASARALLTFVNGNATVNVQRSLSELGVKTAETDRTTTQFQAGLKFKITDNVTLDGYAQSGKVEEDTTVSGDGIRLSNGASRFGALANTANIFKAGTPEIAALGSPIVRDIRERTVDVAAITLTGTTKDLFSLPAGPIGFSLGYEYREDSGSIDHSAEQKSGASFNQGAETAFKGSFDAKEVYGELLIPILADLPFVQRFDLEGAYRTSDYSNAGKYDTDKIGLAWEINDSLKLRATQQSVIRAPNMGEFAGALSSIPFANLVNVARLRPRYPGDPCALGTGNAAQCQRFGYKGTYDSFNPANLTGQYFFGGNKDIKPETGDTKTIGVVFTPEFVSGFSATIDWYDMELRDAVGQVQPVDALTSCYITDPSANNPLCLAVSRDPITGYIKDGFVNDRNLAVVAQKGFDVGMQLVRQIDNWDLIDKMTLSYQANIVTDYSIQRNAALKPIDCKGTWATNCSSDLVSTVQADYKHRAAVTLSGDVWTFQGGWQRIGDLRNSTVGGTGTIPAFNYLDVNVSWKSDRGFTVNFGVDNLTDKKPPLPNNPSLFNTLPDTYNVQGRTVGLSVTWRR
ncbi:TonB-dependent receptor domain-containing protein [Aquidulcibacter paucihalophilus]|uniref:TonB-dependent receptor domain-containing protein n=1 Tax=Aquidulcibacter paucihalophilus TaxID=1978549 RepID=UPI001E4EF82A|nr:TonB-dependent receptor [Aquidulcibacter paucihalophilus]